MKLSEMKIGDKFQFPGNWNTEPSQWEIVGVDEQTGYTLAKPEGSCEEPSLWHDIDVERLDRDTIVRVTHRYNEYHPSKGI